MPTYTEPGSTKHVERVRKHTCDSRMEEGIFCVLLLLAPLAFGAVYPWIYGPLEIGFFAAGVSLLLRHRGTLSHIPPNAGTVCLVCMATIAGFQLIPFPAPLVKALSDTVYMVWQLDGLSLGVPRPNNLLSLALTPFATANEALLFLCYLMVFLTSLLLGKLRGVHSMIPVTIIAAGLSISLIDIFQKLLHAKAIYGFWTPLHATYFTGPYVNSNHFSGYLEMSIPLACSTVVLTLFSRKSRNLSVGLLAFLSLSIVLMLTEMVISRSRGGLMSFGLTFLLLMLIMAYLMKHRFNAKYILSSLGLVLAMAIVAVLLTNWSSIFAEFRNLVRTDIEYDVRWLLYYDVLNTAKSTLVGSGLGTFGDIFTVFKTFSNQGYFAHAHNDYLEYWVELGPTGIALFLVFNGYVLYSGFKTIYSAAARTQKYNNELFMRTLLICGSVCAVLSIMVHGLVDFNLRVPANGFTWFALCGFTIGCSYHGMPLHRRRIHAAPRRQRIHLEVAPKN